MKKKDKDALCLFGVMLKYKTFTYCLKFQMKTKYRVSILGDAVLQVSIYEDNFLPCWRDARVSDLKVLEQIEYCGLKPNYLKTHRVNWLGKLILVKDIWSLYLNQSLKK
jgi:hypothetical protein